MQARVDREVRELAQAAAEASGVSLSFYLEALLRNLAEETGDLPLVANPRRKPQHEELPITAA